ncbi:MAG: cupin domain-containing protein [Gammaproteobacteria bacterium]
MNPLGPFKVILNRQASLGAAMAIHHASSGELIDIRPLKDNLKTTVTKALFKSAHLEVSHIVILADEDVPVHQVAGEMTVQCLEGRVELVMEGAAQLMRAGGEPHGLKAMEDNAFLITMLLHQA